MPLSDSLEWEVKELLNEAMDRYNRLSFIELDPISIPHRFKKKKDIEVSGLMTALISWGNRKAILQTASQWMEMMDDSPFDFIQSASSAEVKTLSKKIYRTFQGTDMEDLVLALRGIYQRYSSLEEVFLEGFSQGDSCKGIMAFRGAMLSFEHQPRFEKHLANPAQNGAAKRINMFLRWMVRQDERKVDFGIWNNISMAQLSLPLDVHTGNIARKLGILVRKQDDWKAVQELDEVLRKWRPKDPVAYDFALFGMGVEGIFND
ncbi:MAG: hypothetical protein RLY35_1087 [Bacteroidota bacterium]|jgi:uncharacterized protein (TIGR02757 family)